MAANFQQMPNAGANPRMMQQQQQMLQHQQQNAAGPATHALQNSLLASIQQQTGPMSGWQANVGINERYGHVWQMVTQLRLAQGNGQQDIQKICMMALHFEKAAFEQSPDKETWTKTLSDKFNQLTAARSRMSNEMQAQMAQQYTNQQAQAQGQQMGMIGQPGMQGQMQRPGMMPQQQAQPSFQHLQHQMQATPLPKQQGQPQPQQQPQQMSANMMGNNLPPNMAQQQFQAAMAQQRQQQQNQQIQQNQQNQQLQLPQQAQPNQQGQQAQNAQMNKPQAVPQLPLTEQEMQLVNQLAQKLMGNATDEDKYSVRLNLQGRMDTTMLQRYQAQNIDPLFLYYRNQALNRIKIEKGNRMHAQQQAQLNGQQQMQQGQGNLQRPPPSVPMQEQRSQNSTPMNAQGQSSQMGVNGDFNTFLGSVENMIGKQHQAGLLAQEAGQQVVPASAPQGTPQSMGMPGQVPTPNGQRPMITPQIRAQQQMFNVQQQQQERLNQTNNASQAQIRATAQAKAQQQMALQGQPGGMGPMPPQQSPALATLNTPMRTPQQQPANPVDPQQMGMPNTGHFGQPIDPRFAQQTPTQNGPAQQININSNIFPASMSKEQRMALMQLPKDKLAEVLNKYKAQGQMPGNMQGGRPGQPPGPFNPQGIPNQFMANAQNGQNGQRPTQGMMSGMNQQQQMLLQQQMGRMPPQQAQNQMQAQIAAIRNGQPPNGTNGQAIMNSMDAVPVPPTLLQNQSMIRGHPPEIKSWGQLKQFIMQNPQNGPPGGLEQIKNFQQAHYQNLMKSKQLQQRQAQAAANSQGMNPGQQVPIVPPGMSAPVAAMMPGQMPGQMPNNTTPVNHAGIGQMHNIVVSQQDIEKARSHPSGRYSAYNDDEIRNMITQSQLARQRGIMQQQQQQAPTGLQIPQVPQMAQMRPQQQPNAAGMFRGAVPQPPQNPQNAQAQQNRPHPPQPQTAPQKPTETAVPPPARLTKPQAARAQQNASPSQPQKNLKRSNSDDVVEVPNPNAQQTPRSVPQQTPAQQRNAQANRSQAAQNNNAATNDKPTRLIDVQASPQDLARIAQIRIETIDAEKRLQPNDIPMNPTQKEQVGNALRNLWPFLSKVNRVVSKWFSLTHDEQVLRQFFQIMHRMQRQFAAQDVLKPAFSVTQDQVAGAHALANKMLKDIVDVFPNALKPGAAGSAAPPSATPVVPPAQPAKTTPQVSKIPPPQQSIPLNAANLAHQQQALNKTQKVHQRSNSHSSKVPAAPTSAHPPPFPPVSEQPVPHYFQKTELTQENLKLPANKKAKHSATSTPQLGQITPGSQASPQFGKTSPEAKKQAESRQEVQQPMFRCPDNSCNHHFVEPFDSEEALARHTEEEHTIHQDPAHYVLDEMKTLLDLDEAGMTKKLENTDPAAAPHLSLSDSQQGRAKSNVGSAAGTPMDRQSSAVGSTKTSKPDPKQAQSSKPVEPTKIDNPWDDTSINPQDLLHNFTGFETGCNGAISNMEVYRSLSPKDTPESSKDSGVSEPNSDISDGVDLNISLDMNMDGSEWLPFGDPFGVTGIDEFLSLNKGLADDGMVGGDSGMFDADASYGEINFDDFLNASEDPAGMGNGPPYVMDTSGFMLNDDMFR